MTTSERSRAGAGPEESDGHQQGLRDFWDVYESHYEEISERLMEWARAHPELGPLVESMPPEQAEQQRRESRELMRRAIHEDEWAPYLESLRTQGATYARAGLGFATWFEVVGGFRRLVRPYLFASFGEAPERMQAVLEAMNRLFDRVLATVGEAYLDAKEGQIRAQQEAIRELSTPVLEVREGLLILPVVGMIDSDRARQITERLLDAIQSHRARVAVLDITGVPAVDSAVANHLLQTVQAARLMGAKVVITGLSAPNAQTLVRIGVDVSGLNTEGNLHQGLGEADQLLGYRVIRTEPRPLGEGA